MGKYELVAVEASYQTQKIEVAAAYAGLQLDVHFGASPADLKVMVPHAKSVVLRVNGGGAQPLLLTRSNTILRFLAQCRPDLGLYGEGVFDSAKVDQWLDFCFNNLEVPVAVLALSGKGQIMVCVPPGSTVKYILCGADSLAAWLGDGGGAGLS
jgi:glutathione S-transferase